VPKALRSVSTFRTGPAVGMSVGTLRIDAATTCGCDLTIGMTGARTASEAPLFGRAVDAEVRPHFLHMVD
jgi:hypothetical protein